VVLSGLLILVLSFVPMLLYAAVLWWLDRYEKEPLALLSVAFLWGAVPSIILALIMQIVLDAPLMTIQGSSQLTYELIGASVVAPLTEEGVKALALIMLLLLFRREIDSPLDGLIYGGMVGFGFASVENVFYLFGALTEGGVGDVLGLAFLRAGIFGLNHAMYTGFAGLGVALFLEVRNKALRFVPLVVGFLMALGAHALHNALATFTGINGAGVLVAAALVDWAGVAVLLAVAAGTFFVERRRILSYAEALVQGHVISEGEVATLKSTFQRRLARLDLLLRGDVRRWWALQRYHQKVTEAAFSWHRLRQGDMAAQPRLARLEREYRGLRVVAIPGPE
jgi:RsiW-degrading membrane proteinase PrsW (M82 family)